MFLEHFWSIWNRGRWIPFVQGHLDRFLNRIILYLVKGFLVLSSFATASTCGWTDKENKYWLYFFMSILFQVKVELVTTGLKDITLKVQNL